MKKHREANRTKLKLSRETISVLSIARLDEIQGGGPTQTKGVGCEPSGIRPCDNG
jgi:hypothetical protein